MNKGRQIKIYLADGSVTGFRHAEIMGWTTGQGLSVPRNKVKELREWEENLKPGVYFLFGVNEETDNDAVYIGEAEQVASRVQQHLSGKDFWNEVVFFTNKDENLTKAYVKYLESRLVALTNEANRFELLNGNQPPQAVLPRGDRDVMEEFIANIRILIGSLGYRLLEPLVKIHELTKQQVEAVEEITTFELKAKKFNAKGVQTDEGFVVLAGAEAASDVNASLSNGYAKVRSALIEKSKLILTNGKQVLQEDYLFSSLSQAAAILLGYACSGSDYWLDENCVSLKQKEAL